MFLTIRQENQRNDMADALKKLTMLLGNLENQSCEKEIKNDNWQGPMFILYHRS